MNEVLFDRVLLLRDGRHEVLTVDEFFALPLSQRIRHVIERTVTFKLGPTEVDHREALAALRRMRASAA